MDFFDYQNQARRNTRWLQSLFALAVLASIVGLYWALMGGIAWYEWWTLVQTDPSTSLSWNFIWQWDGRLFTLAALFCLVVISLGCAIKFMELHSGGAWAAELLGGKRLNPSSSSDDARTLFNVVEEMALASGMAPPPIYILDHEKGINAFAAGYTPEDAVIGVTRGAMTQLARDELQGVIGHEFSHILHGDMRLNLEMIGLLYGLQGLSALGHTILNRCLNHSAYKSNFFTPLHGMSILCSFIAGVGLRIVGFFGVLLASLVKAAVSRQREFLADAAAVQFTRNPAGLAKALKKIGDWKEGSILHHQEASQISHMLFSHGLLTGLDTIFSTHPSLIKRIRRIEPTFAAKTSTTKPTPSVRSSNQTDMGVSLAIASSSNGLSPIYQKLTPSSVIHHIGTSHPIHVSYIHTLISRVPTTIQEAVHGPFGARAVVYALLLSSDAQTRAVQKNRLASHADHTVFQETLKLEPDVQNIEPAARLPLIDMAIPALTLLSHQQYELFKNNVRTIIPQKNHGALFGWTLRRVMLRHLDPHFSPVSPLSVEYRSFKRISHHCGDLLSMLAHSGKGNTECTMHAFRTGKQELGLPTLTLTPANHGSLASLDLTLYALARTTPGIKRTIIKACAACVLADQHVSFEEGELLRGIADALGCPMPPIFAGLSQPVQADSLTPSSAKPQTLSVSNQGATHDHPGRFAKVH